MLARIRARDRQLAVSANCRLYAGNLCCAVCRVSAVAVAVLLVWILACDAVLYTGRQTPYIHTIPILHVIIINVSPQLGIAAVTSSYLQTKQSSSAHTTARSPANPLTLWLGRYQHQGTWGLVLHYQTIFIALSCIFFPSDISTFQASLHFRLTVVQFIPCR